MPGYDDVWMNMARVMKGRLAKGIAQVLALALVVGGLVAFVVTQRGAESAAGAVAEGTESRGFGLGSSVLELERASQVTVDLPDVVTVTSGKFQRSFATGAETVEQALTAGDVTFDDNDIITPARDTPITGNVAVTVERVEVTTETTTESLPFKTVKVQDEDLLKGKTTVLAEGRAGERATTWTITTVDGKQTKREATSTETVREPAERRIAVGTKAPAPAPTRTAAPAPQRTSAPAPTRTASPAPRRTSAPSQASAPTSGVWQALAQCESGGNWSINTGNGYYGGLQFSASSWAAAGGTRYAALPHLATPAQQIATAEVLRSNGGWGHWPACSSRLGLR